LTNDRTDSVPVIGEALLHPMAIAAVVVLLVNDHLLKAHFQGIVTGKLSDFAGLVFFPLLLLTLVDAVWRLARGRSGLTQPALFLCVVVTGLVFIAIKTTDFGADAFRRVWATLQWPARAFAAHRLVPIGRVNLVKDATDLAALPMLLVAYWVGRRVECAEDRPTVGPRRSTDD
jgi:hypothetical protein